MKSSIGKAILVGAAGSLTTNVLQALAKSADAIGHEPPRGRVLYAATLLGDLASNGAYFALVARGPSTRGAKFGLGMLLGIVAGLGAVALPKPLGLTSQTTSRTSNTTAMTLSIYFAGGLIAGLVAAVVDN